MSDRPDAPRDPLDDFLTAAPSTPCASAWKQSLLVQTTRTLRRRHHWKRVGFVTVLAACYAAGALTMRLAAPVSTPQEVANNAPQPAPERTPTPVPVPPAPEVATSARDLEWQAVENPDRRAELFRRAGDRYLNDENDLESAVRCYKHALDAGSDTDLKIAPQDTWLLVSLKNARQEEKPHGKNDG
jgi:hypothetical protein